MSEKKPYHPNQEAQQPETQKDSLATATQEQETHTQTIKEDEQALIKKIEQENKELQEQILRLAADMENLRRRTAKETTEAKNYSIASFARDMLLVCDNLHRALQAIPEKAKESDVNLKAFWEGVEMTERSMLSTLERYGVKKIEPKGEKFDPHFHQAIFEVINENVPSNTIEEVVQPGYIIGERVLRPALVGVSKNEAHLASTKEAETAAAKE